MFVATAYSLYRGSNLRIDIGRWFMYRKNLSISPISHRHNQEFRPYVGKISAIMVILAPMWGLCHIEYHDQQLGVD